MTRLEISNLNVRGRTISRRWLFAAALLLGLAIVIAVVATAEADPVWDCDVDVEGPNNVPGQKDLTRMCQDLSGAADPDPTIFIKWNWDEINWSGNNTGDGCSLYDTNDNGFADYSLCVTIKGSPATWQETRLYSCGDDKAERCTSPIEQISPIASTCVVEQLDEDPFPAGDEYPVDTVATCTVKLDDIPAGPSPIELIDACSYPSTQPNSDPSDCIKFTPKMGTIQVIKDVEPDSAPGLFTLQIDGEDFATDVADGGHTDVIDVSIGTRAVSEIAGTGTDLSHYTTTYTCDKNNVQDELSGSGTDVDIMVADGDDWVCTFTNTIKEARLTLVKTVITDNGGNEDQDDFQAHIDGVPVEWGTHVVPSGTHTVSETVYSGYAPTAWGGDCTPDGNNGTVTVSPGETKVCSITNDDIQPKLIVIKEVNNNYGGLAVSGDFTMTVSGVNVVAPASFPGEDDPGTTVMLDIGSYSVSENMNQWAGKYSDSYSADCSGAMEAGDVKTCTVTNSDIQPKLIVIKKVNNNYGGLAVSGDFTMTVSGVNVVAPASFPGEDDPGTTVMLDVGSYSVSENMNQWAGKYSDSYSADCSGAIEAGDVKTCTVTNSDIQPKLIVIKKVNNNYGGLAVSGDFTMTVSGVNVVAPASFPGEDDPGTTVMLDVGSYSVSENMNQWAGKYSASYSADCSGAIEAGDVKTCTVTNSDIQPKLIVIKTVNNNYGGLAVSGDFTMTVSGVNVVAPASFPGEDDPGTTVMLDVGSYSVSENMNQWAGKYSASYSADCSGAIEAGDVKTCTVTNSDIQPKLIVIKTVNNNYGGLAVSGDFTMTVSGVNVVTPASFPGEDDPGTTVMLDVGSYSVSENMNQWAGKYSDSYSADCSGAIEAGDVKTCTVTNSDIQPKLIVIKTVNNNYGGSAVSGDFTMTVSGVNVVAPASFSGEDDPGTTVMLDVGSYSVSENMNQWAGKYSASYSADCSGAIEAGDVKTCTVTNSDIQPKLIVIKTVNNNYGGLAVSGDFTMTVSGVNVVAPASFPGEDDPGTTVMLDKGSYSVSENMNQWAGKYTADYSADCSSTIDIGDVKTCTVTNSDIAPTLTVIKDLKPDDDPGRFTLWIKDGGETVAFKENVGDGDQLGPEDLYIGTFTVGEDGYGDTSLDGYVVQISGDCAADGSVSLDLAENKTCTITNLGPSIDIDKQIRAFDDGEWKDYVEVIVGTPLYYRFVVTNDGPLDLVNVTVTDPTLGELLYGDVDYEFCTIPTLDIDESVTCPVVPEGPVTATYHDNEKSYNTATAAGCTALDNNVCTDDEDTAYYEARYWAFTPGFWKTHAFDVKNGHDAWVYTAYGNADDYPGSYYPTACDVFGEIAGEYVPCANSSILDNLRNDTRGGNGVDGGARILLRHAIAALLNASFHEVQHGGVTDPPLIYYPMTSQEVMDATNEALSWPVEEEARQKMLDLAAMFDLWNNGFHWIDWDDTPTIFGD